MEKPRLREITRSWVWTSKGWHQLSNSRCSNSKTLSPLLIFYHPPYRMNSIWGKGRQISTFRMKALMYGTPEATHQFLTPPACSLTSDSKLLLLCCFSWVSHSLAQYTLCWGLWRLSISFKLTSADYNSQWLKTEVWRKPLGFWVLSALWVATVTHAPSGHVIHGLAYTQVFIWHTGPIMRVIV